MKSDIIAIIAAYNEEDIIAAVLGHLIAQGVGVYLIDDGSTDRTAEIASRFLGRGLVGLEHRPVGASFAWAELLARKTELARQLSARWFIHHDADEFRESPWPHLNLRDALLAVDAAGYNAVDFEVFNFRPTVPIEVEAAAVDDMSWYEPAADYDQVQIKAWRHTERAVDLVSSGGHEAAFEGRVVCPIRFILRHYPIRSQAQARRKVFAERRGRFREDERLRGWHVQYDAFTPSDSFVWRESDLTRFDIGSARVGVTLHPRKPE